MSTTQPAESFKQQNTSILPSLSNLATWGKFIVSILLSWIIVGLLLVIVSWITGWGTAGATNITVPQAIFLFCVMVFSGIFQSTFFESWDGCYKKTS